MCVTRVCVCMSAHVCIALHHENEEGASEPVELELQIVVNFGLCLLGAKLSSS